jgi:hypothetical protein
MAKAYPRIKEWLSLQIDLKQASPDEAEKVLSKTKIAKQPGYKTIVQWIRKEVLQANVEAAKRRGEPRQIWSEKSSKGVYSWSVEAWRNGWRIYAERFNGRFVTWERL